MNDYAKRYVEELLRQVGKGGPIEGSALGEIVAATAKQPHVAVYLELGEGRCLGTTAGLSERPMPLPVKEGFQYFELCASTLGDNPRVLWLLSNIGNFMLSVLSPFFYGDAGEVARQMETGTVPEPKPFLPYQSLRFGGDDERMLFVPRWKFFVPKGPPVEVVEPLPITPEQWSVLGPMSLEERSAWVAELGARSAELWTRIMND